MAFDPKYGGYVLSTTGAPASTLGQNGDYALDTTTSGGPFIYLKSGSAWGSGTSLKGQAGAAGNLLNVLTKSANYNVVAADLTGGVLEILINAAANPVDITIDAVLLFIAASVNQSLIVNVKRIDSSTNVARIVAGGSGETIEGGTSITILPGAARVVFAASATALYVE